MLSDLLDIATLRTESYVLRLAYDVDETLPLPPTLFHGTDSVPSVNNVILQNILRTNVWRVVNRTTPRQLVYDVDINSIVNLAIRKQCLCDAYFGPTTNCTT